MDPSRPLVSVIVPSYNHERFIGETIRSIWAQTFRDFEIVAVDDGSRDRSPEILERLRTESPVPMRVVHKANEGVCRTLNRGLDLARGSYVTFCSSDDRYLACHLETLVPAIEAAAPGTGMAYADGYFIDEAGNRLGRFSDRKPLRGGRVFEDLLFWRIFMQNSSTIYPREIFDAVGRFDENHSFEDWYFLLRVTRAHPVVYVPVCVSEYRQHGGVRLNRNVARMVPEMIEIFESAVAEYPAAGDPAWLRKARSHLYARIGHNFYIVREFGQARRWLLRAIRHDPMHVKPLHLLLRTLLGRRLIDALSRVREARGA